ncbi:MAG: hypothetical protein WC755_03455 [Candidatus Woesearchaeota archaeon]
MENTSINIENKCPHLEQILLIEDIIAKKNLKNHKWYTHIQNDEEALLDFKEHFSPLVRQMLCGYACIDRYSCNDDETKQHLPKPEEKIENKRTDAKEIEHKCAHQSLINPLQVKIIKDNIDKYKKYKQIETDNVAIKEFLSYFSGIMRQVICGYICCDRLKCEIAGLNYTANIKTQKQLNSFYGRKIRIIE